MPEHAAQRMATVGAAHLRAVGLERPAQQRRQLSAQLVQRIGDRDDQLQPWHVVLRHERSDHHGGQRHEAADQIGEPFVDRVRAEVRGLVEGTAEDHRRARVRVDHRMGELPAADRLGEHALDQAGIDVPDQLRKLGVRARDDPAADVLVGCRRGEHRRHDRGIGSIDDDGVEWLGLHQRCRHGEVRLTNDVERCGRWIRGIDASPQHAGRGV